MGKEQQVSYSTQELRASLVAWLRWHAATQKEIEVAPEACRPILDAMSRVSGVGPVARLASEIEGELNIMLHALIAIERSGAPGATICGHRTDGHACNWCSGMFDPCPVVIARGALEKHSVRLTAESVDSGANDSGSIDSDGEQG
jgi:hypothetical protein